MIELDENFSIKERLDVLLSIYDLEENE